MRPWQNWFFLPCTLQYTESKIYLKLIICNIVQVELHFILFDVMCHFKPDFAHIYTTFQLFKWFWHDGPNRSGYVILTAWHIAGQLGHAYCKYMLEVAHADRRFTSDIAGHQLVASTCFQPPSVDLSSAPRKILLYPQPVSANLNFVLPRHRLASATSDTYLQNTRPRWPAMCRVKSATSQRRVGPSF